MKTWFNRAVAGAMVALTSGACSSEANVDSRPDEPRTTRVTIVDGPVYESVEEVASHSQLFLRGVVGPVVGRELDGGGAFPETARNAVPVMFVELTVRESSDHDLMAPGAQVAVLVDDFDVPAAGEIPNFALAHGSEVLILGTLKSNEQAPGIESVPAFLAPAGGAQGVFDIDGGVARARGESVKALGGERQSDGVRPLEAEVSEVAAAARAVWAK